MTTNKPSPFVPRLRFKEFRNAPEWVQTPLGDAFKTITNGHANAQDHQADGAYPLFDRSEVVKRSSSFLFDAEAVILPGEGMRFQPRYFNGKFDLHQRTYALMEPTLDLRFAFHALDRFKGALADSAVQSTVLSLRMPIIEKFAIPVPPTEAEQLKIGDCLGSLDDLITAEGRKLEALRQHKQGLMQQLFPQPGETRPRLRFTEFEDSPDWEEATLGTLLDRPPDYGVNAAAVPFSASLPTYIRITDINDDGQFAPRTRVSVDIDATDEQYLKDGDIVLARTGASVGKSYRYRVEDGRLVYAGFLIRVRPNPERLLSQFLAAYLSTWSYWDWVRLTSERSGQPGINSTEYASVPLPLPPDTRTLSEQHKIADSLTSMDDKLNAQTRKLDTLKQHKQGLLQQLFPSLECR